MIRKIYKLHKWLGFHLGFVLLFLSLTALPAIFKQEIDEYLNSSIFCLKTVQEDRKNIQLLINIGEEYIKDNYPNHRVTRFILPKKITNPFIVEFKQGSFNAFDWESIKKTESRQLFINPYSGEIILDRDYYKTTAFFIRNIHIRFFINYYGRFIIGLFGAIFFVNIICGIIIYPKFLFKGKIFKLRRSTMKLLWSDIHKLGGFIGGVFMLLICFTGIWLGVQSKVIKWFSIEKPNIFHNENYQVDHFKTEGNIDYEEALNSIKNYFPDFIPHYLAVNESKSFVITFLGDVKGMPFERRTQKVVFDKENLSEPLWQYDIRTRSWKDKLFYMPEALHFGDYGGILLKLVYVFFVLILIGVILSGYYLYYQKSNDKEYLKQLYKRYFICFLLGLTILFILHHIIGAPLTSFIFMVFVCVIMISVVLKKIKL